MAKNNNLDAQQKAWAKIVAKAWSDEVFKQRLLNNPEAVFQEYGLETPAGVSFKIHENTNKTVHIALPSKPMGQFTEEELKKVAGGGEPHPSPSSTWHCQGASCPGCHSL